MSNHNLTRRQFLKAAAFTAVMIPFAGMKNFSFAAESKDIPAGMKAVPESDAVANAMGYKADVKNLDYKKYPQRKKPDAKKQFCDNCERYTKVNAGWGNCSMITGGLVAAKGWCASYSKKA